MTNVALGGTFEVIHRGHRALLVRAFLIGDHVLIGLTTDDFANSRRPREVLPYRDRQWALEEFFANNFPLAPYVIQPIDDEFGPAVDLEDLDVLVVSENTHATGVAINEERAKRGFQPLRILTIPHVLADDGKPISSTRVLAGECDVNGRIPV